MNNQDSYKNDILSPTRQDILALESQIRHLLDIQQKISEYDIEQLLYKYEIISQRYQELQGVVAQLRHEVAHLNNACYVHAKPSAISVRAVRIYLENISQKMYWATRNPLKFCKKYIYKHTPTYSQVMWAIHNPTACIKKHIFGIQITAKNQPSVLDYIGPVNSYSIPSLPDDTVQLYTLPDIGVLPGEVVVIMHLYYIDMWEEMAQYLRHIPVSFELIITLTDGRFSEVDKDRIRALYSDVVFVVRPNKGMDVLPFLHALQLVPDTCKYLLKIHTKKSLHIKSGEGYVWFMDLMHNVLGGRYHVMDILKALSGDTIGMVGGSRIFDEIMHVQHCAKRVQKQLGIRDVPYTWVAGTMFWVRYDLLRPLRNTDFLSYIEKYQPDGYIMDQSPAHALERLFGLLVYSQKKTLAQIKRKKVLFINHQESVTGAPKIIKEYISRIIEDKEFDYAVVSKVVLDDPWYDVPHRYVLSEMKQMTNEEKMAEIERIEQPDIVIGNTIEAAEFLQYCTAKKIIFIHEYRLLYGYASQLDILSCCDEVWVGNSAAASILAERGIQAMVIPYYLNIQIPPPQKFPHVEGKPYFLGAGSIQYRKGMDRFFALARALPHERFVWIGSSAHLMSSAHNTCVLEYQSFLEDGYVFGDPITIKTLNLDIPDNVEFIDVVPEDELIGRWIANAKAFLMVSYDDPFPLVAVYAKILGKQVLIMKSCGDAYILCKEPYDLILESFDLQKAVTYLSSIRVKEDIVDYALKQRLYDNYVYLQKAIVSEYDASSIPKKRLLTVFTAIHSASQPFSFELLDKTIASLLLCDPVTIYILTDKKTDLLEQTVRGRGTIIEHEHRLHIELMTVYTDAPHTTGCYLRTEIPYICNTYNINEEYVLYVDYDILCISDLRPYLYAAEPMYIAAGPCMRRDLPHEINSGVMYMHIPALLSVDIDFLEFMRPRIAELRQTDGQDQQAYREFFSKNIQFLPEEMNWKPYWGINHQAALIHYHWIKPHTDITTADLQKHLAHLPKDFFNKESMEYYQRYWKQFYGYNT